MSPRTILGGYTSYHFREHDPILDQVDRLLELAGNPTREKVSERSGVTEGTLYNWYRRKTKRPQFATVKAVVQGLGGHLAIEYRGRIIRTNGSGK